MMGVFLSCMGQLTSDVVLLSLDEIHLEMEPAFDLNMSNAKYQWAGSVPH